MVQFAQKKNAAVCSTFFSLLLLMLSRNTVLAQQPECIEQKPAETIIINKAVAALKKTIEAPLLAMGWVISSEEDGSDSQVASNGHPFRPMMLCHDLLDLKLTLDPGSPAARQYEDSLTYYGKQAENANGNTQLLVQSTKNISRIRAMETLEIIAFENTPYLTYGGPMNENDKLLGWTVKGVPFAYREYRAPASELDNPQETAYLFFGNWNGAAPFKGSYTPYPFVHKVRSAFIENMQVKILAPTALVNAVTARVDWAALNDALTR